MSQKKYNKGGALMWTYDHNQIVDLNLTAQRSHLADGTASILIGMDNTRPGVLRSADPRKPLSVSSPDSADIVFAQGSDFSGRYTNVQADEMGSDYSIITGPNGNAASLAITPVGFNKGIRFSADMVGGIVVLDTGATEPYQNKIASTSSTFGQPNDTINFARESAVNTWSTGDTFAILWEKEYDKRGIWMTDGRRIYLVQNDTVTKYLDIGTDAALGTKWHGTKISTGEFMFVNDLYAPRVISLNAEAAGSDEDLSQLAGMSVPESETDRTNHASDLTTSSTGGFIDPSTGGGVYRVRIRFVDERSGTASRFVQLHATAIVGSDDFISVPDTTDTNKLIVDFQSATYSADNVTQEDNIPNVPRATHIEIYRTDEGGVNYWLERSLPIARDGNYIENSDSDLTIPDTTLFNRKPLNILDERHGGLPPIGRKITSISGVTLIAGKANDARADVVLFSNKAEDPIVDTHTHELPWPTVEDDNTVYLSALDAFLPESFSPQDKLRLSDIGDSFQNFGTAGGIAVAVMTEGAYRLQAVGLSLVKTTIGERGIGTAWPESVISVGKYVIWASPKGMIAYDTLFDRATGGYEYLASRSGEFLESWLAEAFLLQDDIFCGYDQRDDILRVRRSAKVFTPYSAVQVGDYIKFTNGDNNNRAHALTAASGKRLEWFTDLENVLKEGDTFDVLPGTSSIATGTFASDGDQVTTTSIDSTSSPFTNSAAGDFVVFTNGANNNLVREIDTQTNDKITWVNPVGLISNNDTVVVASDDTSLIGGLEYVHHHQLVSATEYANLPQSIYLGTDPASGADVWVAFTDGVAGVGAGSVSGTDTGGGAKYLRLQFSGKSDLLTNNKIILTTTLIGTSTLRAYPYNADGTINSSVFITVAVASPRLFLLTSNFISALATLGDDDFAIRLVSTGASATCTMSEIEGTSDSIFGRVVGATKTTLTAHINNPWNELSVGDLIHFQTGVNVDEVRRVATITVSNSVLTWAEELPNVPASKDRLNIYADTAVDSHTVAQEPWTLGSFTAIAPTLQAPFSGVSPGDLIVFPDNIFPDRVRTITLATSTRVDWAFAVQLPVIDDSWRIISKDAVLVSDTIDEDKMSLSLTAIEVISLTSSRVLQYSFKLKTWAEFDNDPGINYASSVYADSTILQAPALFSPTKHGTVFEINARGVTHPYDEYTQQEDLSAANYNITDDSIEIRVSSVTRRFRSAMLGDSVRIISASSERDGAVRGINHVNITTLGGAHKITFEPPVPGLSAADSFVVGGNHFRVRFAPYFGTDYSSVKTVHGCVVHAAPGARHAGNTNWPDPPTGKIDVRCYQNLGDTPISEQLSEISIFDEDDTSRITEDRYSAVEGQGNTLEIEIESKSAKTDFRLDHLSCDVVEHVIDLVDTSTDA